MTLFLNSLLALFYGLIAFCVVSLLAFLVFACAMLWVSMWQAVNG